LRVLELNPPSTFGRSGKVYDFREEDSNGAREASGRRLGKEAEGEFLGGFFGVFFGREIWWGPSFLD